jgi:uncharacterized protein with von Willebrand factor type A (vWA) domain
LYEWEYAKQLLYTQILKDKINEVLGGASSLKQAVERIANEDDVFFSDRFILPRPLLRAISSSSPCVLLIDEIDKADNEFEAFLLEVLSDFQVSVPELGTLRARHIPLVVLTSNNAREMSDALKRRCLHLYIDFPAADQELEIVRLKVPGITAALAQEVVNVVQRIRRIDLKKTPSISETLDWAKALVLLNVDQLDPDTVGESLSTVLRGRGPKGRQQQPAPRAKKTFSIEPSRRAPQSMDNRIIEFTSLLRQNGVRVSMVENMDTFQALRLIGLGDRTAFKDALRSTLVKRAIDAPVYDDLFELYFSGLGAVVKDSATRLMESMELDEAAFQDLLDRLAELLKQMNVDLSALAQALLRNDTGETERLLRQASQAAGLDKIQRSFQEGRYAHSMAQQLGLGGLAEELEALKGRLAAADLDPVLRERLQRLIDRRLQDLTEMIKRAVRVELEKQDYSLRENKRTQSLAEKSFYYLSEDEIRRMREAVTKLAERLKNVVSVRRRRGKRGKFDLKDTLRKNLQYGGVPFKIQFDRRVREKPQVLVLCDVSDSVRNVSRFMLQFVYSLQDLYSRVRSFIFVSELGEVTHLFEEQEINEAIEQSLSGGIINVFAHSDFGRAFRTFQRDYIGAVNNRTTVIVLGDARNNYNLPHEWVLKEIQQRAKQVIWLNPENRLTWGFGDSEMDRYQPYCDVVEECRNLNQLYRVVDRLVS